MAEQEAHLRLHSQTGDLRPEVVPSDEQCNTDVAPSKQGHCLAPSEEYIHTDKLIGFGDSARLPSAT